MYSPFLRFRANTFSSWGRAQGTDLPNIIVGSRTARLGFCDGHDTRCLLVGVELNRDVRFASRQLRVTLTDLRSTQLRRAYVVTSSRSLRYVSALNL